MDNPEMVLIQATRTYLEGFEYKSERSDPYAVTRSHGLQLEAQGFARIVGPQAAEKSELSGASDTAPAEESQDTPAARKRGRPPRAR